VVAAGDLEGEALSPKRAPDAAGAAFVVPALCVRVPADPTSLAVVRAQLREWFQAAGVGTETAADLLLAVGEAASNAAEHACDGLRQEVELTVTASVAGDQVRLVTHQVPVLSLELRSDDRWPALTLEAMVARAPERAYVWRQVGGSVAVPGQGRDHGLPRL
jgi:hypothetical protein